MFMVFGLSIGIGLLFMAYGLVVAAVRAGTRFYAVWLLGGLAIILLGAGYRFDILGRIPKPVLYPVVGAIGVLTAVVLFTFVLVMSKFNAVGNGGTDAVIVLGAQIIDERPSIVLKKRLDTAADYLKENQNAICVVTGGQGSNEIVPEAKVMRDYLVSAGIEEERIIVEDKSTNTSENIDFSKKLLPESTQSVAIVTSNFHLYRGVSIAKKAGLPNVVGVAAPSSALYLPNNVFRECLGIVKDFLVGNI